MWTFNGITNGCYLYHMMNIMSEYHNIYARKMIDKKTKMFAIFVFHYETILHLLDHLHSPLPRCLLAY